MMNDSELKNNTDPEFRSVVDKHLNGILKEFYDDVPGAKHLLESDEINEEYYKRHVIEIILRLRMKRVIDGLTIHYFTKSNPFLAKKWCEYSADEMLHDRMFVRDLKKYDLTLEDVYDYEPYFSTKILQGYFYYGLEHEGKPLASLSSSYFIEQLSLATQMKWMENVEKNLGKDAAKGQIAHVKHDLEDDHTDFAWEVLMTFVKNDNDKERIIGHITNVGKLFKSFYTELYFDTIGKNKNINPLTYSIDESVVPT